MGRRFKNYIDTCVEASGHDTLIPLVWRKWATLSSIAGAMGRKAWYHQGNWIASPNMFIVLVGNASAGKGLSLNIPYNEVFTKLCEPVGENLADERRLTEHIWKGYMGVDRLPLHYAKDKMSAPQLAMMMASITRLCEYNDEEWEAPISILTPEFGTFMQRNEKMLQTMLTQAWDREKTYSDQLKISKSAMIKGPCVNWIAGSTPVQLTECLPNDSAEQGLLSRIILVYHGEKVRQTKFKVERPSETLINDLTEDLAHISTINGEFDWETEALRKKAEKVLDDLPEESSTLLENYAGRRISHLCKIMMCLSAARTDKMVFTEELWEEACDWLFEIEPKMLTVLRRFGMGATGRIADDLISYVFSKGEVSAPMLRREAMRTCRSTMEIDSMIQQLIQTEELREVEQPDGTVTYKTSRVRRKRPGK